MTATFDHAAKPDPQLLDLARRALQIALRGPSDPGMGEIAERVVQRIAREHPEQGLWTACLAWCDTLQARCPELATETMTDAGLAFVEAGTDRRSFADDTVPEQAQWAGRFLHARLRDDPDAAYALFRSTADGWQMGARVMALLQMCALNIDRGHVDLLTTEQVTG